PQLTPQAAVAGAQARIVTQRTSTSHTIGTSLVGPRNRTISATESTDAAPASGRHQAPGTQRWNTASVASTNSAAVVTARKNPGSGKPPETVIRPKGPLSPSAQGPDPPQRAAECTLALRIERDEIRS